jgi:DNA-binding response OmpR family regulator
VLRDEGYTVDAVSSGEVPRSRHPRAFDLIVLDVVARHERPATLARLREQVDAQVVLISGRQHRVGRPRD